MTKKLARRALRPAGAGWLFALALLAAAPVQAQDEPALLKRASDLRESPGDAGRALATLPADSSVTRLGDRQGPWVRVKAASGTTGWLHMFDIAPVTSSGSGGATGALRSLTGLFSKSATQKTTTSTATIGIRGLGAEDIAQAQPDLAAVARMEALRASDGDVRQFARQASLAPVQVAPLPVPDRTAPSTSAGGPQ